MNNRHPSSCTTPTFLGRTALGGKSLLGMDPLLAHVYASPEVQAKFGCDQASDRAPQVGGDVDSEVEPEGRDYFDDGDAAGADDDVVNENDEDVEALLLELKAIAGPARRRPGRRGVQGRRGRPAASDGSGPPVLGPASGSEAHAEAPLLPTLAQVEEDFQGVLRVRGCRKPLGQLTAWRSSVSARCTCHGGKCNRAYVFTQMPEPSVLREWLLDGLSVVSAAVHMGLVKPLRQ